MCTKFLIVTTVLLLLTSYTSIGSSLHTHISTEDIECQGESTGKITIQLSNVYAEYQVAVKPYGKNSTRYFTGETDSLHQIKNLQADKYSIQVSSENKVYKDTIVIISEPKPFVVEKIIPLQLPDSDDSDDGKIVALAKGGLQPYAFQWDEKTGLQTTDTAINLPYGIYTCTVTDASTCDDNSKRMTIYFIKEALEKQSK